MDGFIKAKDKQGGTSHISVESISYVHSLDDCMIVKTMDGSSFGVHDVKDRETINLFLRHRTYVYKEGSVEVLEKLIQKLSLEDIVEARLKF